MPYDALMRRVLELVFRAHGGTGLSLTRTEVMSMSPRELLWWEQNYQERLDRQKKAYDQATANAPKR